MSELEKMVGRRGKALNPTQTGLAAYDFDEVLSFVLAFRVNPQVSYNGQGWRNEPKDWWTDVYTVNAMLDEAERKVERKGRPFEGVKKFSFEELAVGD